jgi:hypothetical protein
MPGSLQRSDKHPRQGCQSTSPAPRHPGRHPGRAPAVGYFGASIPNGLRVRPEEFAGQSAQAAMSTGPHSADSTAPPSRRRPLNQLGIRRDCSEFQGPLPRPAAEQVAAGLRALPAEPIRFAANCPVGLPLGYGQAVVLSMLRAIVSDSGSGRRALLKALRTSSSTRQFTLTCSAWRH